MVAQILLTQFYTAAIAQDFQIEAEWVGATQWMSGVNNGEETFGGSIAKGMDFFGSSILVTEFVPVEIRFDSDSANWSNAQVFRRDMTYESVGVGTFPGTVWDISDSTNPRQLNICFVEHEDGGGPIPSPNMHWDPDSTAWGKYEYLFIMASDYDSTGNTYAGINLLFDDPDIQYAWLAKVASGHTFFETEPASLYIFPRMVLAAPQTGYNAALKWFAPGPPPDHYKIFFQINASPDSFLTQMSYPESTFIHTNLTSGQDYHYVIKSYSASGNEILTSLEQITHIRTLPFISSVSPAQHFIQADVQTDIVVTFDSAMNPATINSSSFKVFGHWSGPNSGTFQMENGNTQVRFTPDEPFSAGEWVLVNMSKSVETSNGTVFPSGFSWTFWIKTLPAPIQMREKVQIPVRRSGEGHIQCYGAYGGDLNNDGFMDITIINELTDDVRVFLNDGSGGYDSMTVFSFIGGGVPSPNDGADFNSDGIIDLAVGATQANQLRILIGDGNGGFDIPASYYITGNNNRGVAILDLNSDAMDDVATTNYGASKAYTLINDGSGNLGTITEIETGSNGEYACASADANNDGVLDLFVGTLSGREMVLLLGDGDGHLSFASKVSSGGETWMIAVGDVNLDGNVDVVCANSGYDNASVIFGDGLGGMSAPVTYDTPDFPIAIDLGDIDGDGDLDLVTSSYAGNVFRVFENDGSGGYASYQDYPSGSSASCITLYDKNNDGIMDMTGIDEIQDLIFIFESSCCVGLHGDVNYDGFNNNILDLNFLVNYIFRLSGDPGQCPEESDVNGDGFVANVLDLNYLVNTIFRLGPLPPACP